MKILQDPRILELKNHTNVLHHDNVTLFEHLYGTYQILKEKNKPEYLCMAGFFHSIYETEYFNFETPYTREKIKNLIGEQAENLVYEFCKLDLRINSLISKSNQWSDQVYADLLDIELANMAQQGYYNESIKLLEAIRKHLKIEEAA